MVLEQLYSSQWIESKAKYAFLMGLSYSIIGIFSAMFLFPDDPAIVSIAFTTMLILPSLNKLFSIEEEEAAEETSFEISDIFKNHKDIFLVYTFLFLGILLAYSFFSVVWPVFRTESIFSTQAAALGAGKATSLTSFETFKSYISNNLGVMVFTLIASIVYGAGSIFIITWNASAWGVVFGIVAREAAISSDTNPFWCFAKLFAIVFVHMILEGSAYFMAAISGGIVSKGVIKEELFSDRFTKIMQDAFAIFILALIVLVLAAFVEAYFAGKIVKVAGVC